MGKSQTLITASPASPASAFSRSPSFAAGGSFQYDQYQYDQYDQYDSIPSLDFSAQESFNAKQTTTTTTHAPMKCTNGSLILYSKTYYRGDKIELTESLSDLKTKMFNNTAVTAKLTGDCCWEIFADINFSGEVFTLNPEEEYKSVKSFGNLFRDAESVKKSAFIC